VRVQAAGWEPIDETSPTGLSGVFGGTEDAVLLETDSGVAGPVDQGAEPGAAARPVSPAPEPETEVVSPASAARVSEPVSVEGEPEAGVVGPSALVGADRFVDAAETIGAGAGQVRAVSVGRRTSVASGSQSPAVPSGATARRRRGPKAEGPNAFNGWRTARMVCGSSRMNEALESETLSVVWRESSGRRSRSHPCGEMVGRISPRT
jgi:hypothetical protein